MRREIPMTHAPRKYEDGCRCEACVFLHNERVKRNRRERLERGELSHGTRSAYDAGCRCADCKRVRAEAYRRLERTT